MLIKSRILDEEKITIITNKEKIVLDKEKSEKNISFEDNEEIVLSIIQEQTPRIPIVLLFIANLFVFLIELFLQDTFLRANNKWTTKAKPFFIN